MSNMQILSCFATIDQFYALLKKRVDELIKENEELKLENRALREVAFNSLFELLEIKDADCKN